MLVGEMVSAIKAVLDDYNRSNMEGLLQEAVNLASQRGRVPENLYLQQVQSIHSRANDIIASSQLDLEPADIREKIYQSAYRDILPTELAKMLLVNLPLDDTRGAPSEEINRYKTQFINSRNALAYFNHVAAGMHEVNPRPEDGIAIFKTVISDESTEQSAKKLGRLLIHFDDFFNAVMQLDGRPHDAPKIFAASTGSIDFSFACDPAAYAAIAHAYDALLKAAIESTRLLRAINFLRTNPLITPGTMLGQDVADKAVETIIERSFEAQIDLLRQSKGDEAATGAKIKIKTTGIMIVEELRRGTKFTFDVESVRDTFVAQERGDETEKPKLLTVLKDLNGLQKALDAAVSEAKEFLQIEDHSDEEQATEA